jgi:hypothetical protein
MNTGGSAHNASFARSIILAALLVGAGGFLMRGAGAAEATDPTASIDNAGPRGLLALHILLQRQGFVVDIIRGSEFLTPASTASIAPRTRLLILPPPEHSGLSKAEAHDLLSLVHQGARLLVLCDGDERRTRRLQPLLHQLGIACTVDDDAPSTATTTTLVPGLPAAFFLHDRGRLDLGDSAGVVPFSALGDAVVAAGKTHGAGDVVVLASASAVANDGVAQGDGASFVAFLARGRTVTFDERFHRPRTGALLRRAWAEGSGPLTAVVAVLLLVASSLLSLAPRPGDPPVPEAERPVPSTTTRVRGLAALLFRGARKGSAGSTPWSISAATTPIEDSTTRERSASTLGERNAP